MNQTIKIFAFIIFAIALASVPIQWDRNNIITPICQQIGCIMVVAWTLKFTYKQIDKLT